MSTYNEVKPVELKSNSEDNWPTALKTFVSECFVRSNYLNKTDKIEFQNQLQKLMQRAFEQDKIWENDWQRQKLPILDKNCVVLDLYCNINQRDNDTVLPISGSLPLPTSSNYLPLPSKKRPKSKRHVADSDEDTYLSTDRKKSRMERFETEHKYKPVPISSGNTMEWGGDIDKPLIGTCKNIEKNYLRLTSAPDPSRVRPLPILKKTLSYILEKYTTQNKDYSYLCDQFKSIRQDLTVQFIKNDFTVKVYETHARIAIDNGDLGEYNQCQSQLLSLYGLNMIKGENKFEFIAYRILYYIMTGNYNDIYKLRLSLDSKSLRSSVIKDAIKLQKNQLIGNYHDFFKIFSITQNKGKKLIEFFIGKERIKALYKISKSYKKIWINFLITELKFENQDLFIDFLKEYKLDEYILIDDNINFDCNRAKFKLEELNTKIHKKIDIKGQV